MTPQPENIPTAAIAQMSAANLVLFFALADALHNSKVCDKKNLSQLVRSHYDAMGDQASHIGDVLIGFVVKKLENAPT